MITAPQILFPALTGLQEVTGGGGEGREEGEGEGDGGVWVEYGGRKRREVGREGRGGGRRGKEEVEGGKRRRREREEEEGVSVWVRSAPWM